MDNEKDEIKDYEPVEGYPLRSSEAFCLLATHVIETKSEEGILYRLYGTKDKHVRAKMQNYKGKWISVNALQFFLTNKYRWRTLTKKEVKDFSYDMI